MYAKIFESIYDGSLRRDWKALIVFQQMLVLCDEEGYIDKTPEAISARTTIPQEIISHGIKELSSPDSESRSREEQGRRIVLINPNRTWGWRIVNYSAYRDIRNHEQLRSYWRGQKAESRASERSQSNCTQLKKEINKLYNRKSADNWSYAEECQLLEIARRNDCLEELQQMMPMRSKNGRFFPQSVERLLSNWTIVLDRSRNKNQTVESRNPNIL